MKREVKHTSLAPPLSHYLRWDSVILLLSPSHPSKSQLLPAQHRGVCAEMGVGKGHLQLESPPGKVPRPTRGAEPAGLTFDKPQALSVEAGGESVSLGR